jgi:hypothetical protein
VRGQCFLYVQHPVPDDCGGVENAPLNADAGMEQPVVVLAGQIRRDHRPVQPQVDLIHGGWTTVQVHALPLVGPDHQVVAALIDHNDGDVGAG